MKKILSLIGIILIAASCERDNADSNESQIFERNLELKSVMNSKIGKIDSDGAIHLTATDASIRIEAQKFLRKGDEKASLVEYHVEDIDGKSYLRWSGDNNKVATVALNVNPQNGDVSLGETVCESTRCASGGGCVPDGQYCTECRPYGPSGVKGDCKRTTTGGNEDPSLDP
ncbi:hypothetical protein BST97_01940 [Nonlabens spongiae]|uniref:Uncharacterized protein n=1 Tax=Nonlabens spongiae TaxID=331648 RepID=A0A1W6MGY0_9FLAO|nr:hypothetical protein [Nonlabens spongiae]ARN76858.1 hypothetical protein BST97_01940 [Nonlabens spongiae]